MQFKVVENFDESRHVCKYIFVDGHRKSASSNLSDHKHIETITAVSDKRDHSIAKICGKAVNPGPTGAVDRKIRSRINGPGGTTGSAIRSILPAKMLKAAVKFVRWTTSIPDLVPSSSPDVTEIERLRRRLQRYLKQKAGRYEFYCAAIDAIEQSDETDTPTGNTVTTDISDIGTAPVERLIAKRVRQLTVSSSAFSAILAMR